MKKLTVFFALAVLLALCVPALAAETEVFSVSTPEELMAMANRPEGSYVLACDLDMAGYEWVPFGFSGTLDGNGHSILNLTVTRSGDNTEDTYDGNMKVYDTSFAGLFSTLKNGEVKNLNLVNIRALVETDLPCFLGAVAGYMDHGTISGCSVSGTLELRAHDRQFGIGGIVGFGNGTITDTGTDVTLICVDTDATTRDEQFLGGAYGAGYIDLDGVEIRLAGFISEHGYVHSGGAVGMYALYPAGTNYAGYIKNTHITGKITFFEDNTNRRAYCKELVGETLHWTYTVGGNWAKFTRDERYDYSRELRPEMCENPIYGETVVTPDGLKFGYSEYVCATCGYTYRDHYTIHDHVTENWTLIKAPTVEEFGMSEGHCDICGKTLTREEPKLDPPPTTAPSEAPTTLPTVPADPGTDGAPGSGIWAAVVLLVVLVAALIVCLLLIRQNNRRRRRRRRRR